MVKIIKLKPIVNKSNGQINVSLKSKDFPKEVIRKIRENKGDFKTIKFIWDGFE